MRRLLRWLFCKLPDAPDLGRECDCCGYYMPKPHALTTGGNAVCRPCAEQHGFGDF